MAKENSGGERFGEYLDRLLTGEELPAGYEDNEEFRKALDFAGKMKALRAEPSPEFSERLRQRLLDKLAEQEAREQSESASFRKKIESFISGLFSRRLHSFAIASAAIVIILAVAAVVLLRTAYFQPLPGDMRVNFPAAAPSSVAGFQTAAVLPALPDKAQVYNLTGPGLTVASLSTLGKRLGLTTDITQTRAGLIGMSNPYTGATLKADVNSGIMEYSFPVSKATMPILPNEVQAKEIAKSYLSQMDLAHGVLVSGDVREISGNGTPAYMSVRFASVVNGIRTSGPGALSEVRIGNYGFVTGFTIWNHSIAAAREVPLKSTERGFEDLKNGRGYCVLPPETKNVSIRNASIGYWLDDSSGKQMYLVPVIEFSGECLDEAGNFLGNFSGWVDAVAR